MSPAFRRYFALKSIVQWKDIELALSSVGLIRSNDPMELEAEANNGTR